MNLYEVTLHDTESFYLLTPTKYRALEEYAEFFPVRRRFADGSGKFFYDRGQLLAAFGELPLDRGLGAV